MSEPNEPTEDDLIAAAMAAMEAEPPGTSESLEPPPEPPELIEGAERGDQPPEPPLEPEFTELKDQAEHQQSGSDPSPFDPRAEPQSLVLQELDENRRPKARTVCEHCPNSVWFSSPTEVKCYCRVMFLVSWSTKEPNQITKCDGIFLGEE